MHCGEWLYQPPQNLDSMGRAAGRWVTFQIIWAAISLIAGLIFFFAFFCRSGEASRICNSR
jgi:hypothetical protein